VKHRQLRIYKPPFIQRIRNEFTEKFGIHLFLRREDVIHPSVSGNKWRKLRYNLPLIPSGHTLVTFGGAYSNHIYATAAACKDAGIPSIGIIRGERVDPLSPTLQFATSCGMKLKFVSRSDYRSKETLKERLFAGREDIYLLPEGGTNIHAIRGCAEIMDKEMEGMDVVCCPVGTGGTLAGLVSSGTHVRFEGYSALKADLQQDVESLLAGLPHSPFALINDYHFGGYARISDELIAFIKQFYEEQDVLLDPVYTGKMLYGIMDRLPSYPHGTRICAIHTGGLQGWGGVTQRFGIDPESWESTKQ
jgi:1-aminocyclopropane-1-carboxylate deaminase/D-cysteine desulfhydrase-like pyridoxal-dependent ACC family enzyme